MIRFNKRTKRFHVYVGNFKISDGVMTLNAAKKVLDNALFAFRRTATS